MSRRQRQQNGRRTPHILVDYLFCVAATLVVLMLSSPLVQKVTAQSLADTLHRCTDDNIAPIEPCGADARYAFDGVVSDLSITDIQEIDPDYANYITNTLAQSPDIDLTETRFTRLAYRVYFDADAESDPDADPLVAPAAVPRCLIDHVWSVSTVSPNPPQCAPAGPCTDQGSCLTLTASVGGTESISFRVAISVDSLMYVQDLGTRETSLPFERTQIMRKQSPLEPNRDVEDDSTADFYTNVSSTTDPDDDDDYNVGVPDGTIKSGTTSDDDDVGGGGAPMYLDDDNENICTGQGECDGKATAWEPCYSDSGTTMVSQPHLYSATGDADLSYAVRNTNSPLMNSNRDNPNSRVLNPQVAFGASTDFTPSTLFFYYENDGIVPQSTAGWAYDDCVLTDTSRVGCYFGPKASEWTREPTATTRTTTR